MNTFWIIILGVLIVFPLVFFMKHALNGCPGRKNHEWEYIGTEIYKGYKGPVKCKKYICKNCGKIKYE